MLGIIMWRLLNKRERESEWDEKERGGKEKGWHTRKRFKEGVQGFSPKLHQLTGPMAGNMWQVSVSITFSIFPMEIKVVVWEKLPLSPLFLHTILLTPDLRVCFFPHQPIIWYQLGILQFNLILTLTGVNRLHRLRAQFYKTAHPHINANRK